MILKLSILGVHVAMAASAFDVEIPLSDRSLETSCVTNIRKAVVLWNTDRNSAENTYGNIEDWCTKDLTTFFSAFATDTGIFNKNISNWDTSSSTSFQQAFNRAASFAGDVSLWDTSKSIDFSLCFHMALSFNSDISSWDTSKGVDFNSMFYEALSFNQDLSGWDTSGTTVMRDMFRRASIFNQNLSRWDVSRCTDFFRMFQDALEFGQCLRWDLSTLGNASEYMFLRSNGASAGDNCPAPGPDTTQPTSKPSSTQSTPPTSNPSSTPTTPSTSNPSSTPTTLIETIKNYNITLEKVNLDSSNLTLTATYTMSDISNKSQSKISIMDKNCNRTYGGVVSDKSVNDTSPIISERSMLLSGSSLLATFQIDKFGLETSLLTSAIGNVDKAVAGELHFCLKTEVVIGGISLNFRESDIVVKYDLSANAFSITNNKVEKEAIITSTKSVSNIYSIWACRCGATSYDCLTNGEKSQSLNQDSLVHVCLKPNATDVRISTFYMQFLKDGTNQVDFQPVRNSVGVLGSSVVRGSGTVSTPFKVTSRLISESFANGATKFDIKGDADLQFNSNKRKLNLRSSDNTLQVEGEDAGTAPYKMSVEIVGNDISETGYFTTAFTTTVGAGLVLSIVIVIYKKVS